MRVQARRRCGDRRRTLTVLLALVAAAVADDRRRPPRPPAPPRKQAPVLAQGAGMGAKPSAAVRQRAARAAQPRLQPRPTGSRRALRPADRRRRAAACSPTAGWPPTASSDRRPAGSSAASSAARSGPPARTTPAAARAPSRRRRSRTTTRRPRTAPTDGGHTTTAAAPDGSSPSRSQPRWPRSAPAWRSRGDAPTRSRGQPPAIVPLAHELYLEGHSAEESIGGLPRARDGHDGRRRRPGMTPTRADAGISSTTCASRRRSGSARTTCGACRRALQPGSRSSATPRCPPRPTARDADAAVHEIEAACERAEWELAEVVTDRESGRGLERPGLAYAMEQIAEGKARGLVVSDLRRLSRSIVDLGRLMEWFRDAGAGLVALDLGVDTSTPAGHEVAATLITLGDWERERIARRTRSGLAEVRASRPPDRPPGGQRPPRPGRAHHRDARGEHDPAGHRRPAQRRGRAHAARRRHVATLERPGGPRLPAPGTRGPRDQFPTLEDRV